MDTQYFKRSDSGEIVQITKEEADTLETYGIKDEKSGHIFTYHNECDKDHCNICNLSVCLACGTYEGGLTTECCGKRLTMDEADDIYNGVRDFRYGRWIEGVTNNVMVRNSDVCRDNLNKVLEAFKEEIENKTELGIKVIEQEKARLKQWLDIA